MEVDGTHLEALESADRAQFRATEVKLGKIAVLNSNLCSSASIPIRSPESIEKLSQKYALQESQCDVSS